MAAQDLDLLFTGLSQAITAAAPSTNVIDLGALGVIGGSAGDQLRNRGAGTPINLFIQTLVAMTDTGSDSTLTVTLQTDDSPTFGSPTSLGDLVVTPAVQPVGRKFFVPLPVSPRYERYIRLNFTPNNGNLTTGSFRAGLVPPV
jgi:hypothetical protein